MDWSLIGLIVLIVLAVFGAIALVRRGRGV